MTAPANSTTGKTCVVISTTGDPHRLPLLRQCVEAWDKALGREPGDGGHALFVTVDGPPEAVARVAAEVVEWSESVYRVGQEADREFPIRARDGRLGVAVSKNTGIELFMGNTDAEHLFLSDDDTWPLSPKALYLHTRLGGWKHTMVNWGKHRLGRDGTWTWPRGAVLYVHRDIIDLVGGMVEAFGPGGHEHVEFSRRIFQRRMCTEPFPSPPEYRERGGMGAVLYWHAEDMRRKGEPLGNHRLRRRKLTTVRRQPEDWGFIEDLMAARDGNTAYVPYRASQNGRASATLWEDLTSQGAGGEK